MSSCGPAAPAAWFVAACTSAAWPASDASFSRISALSDGMWAVAVLRARRPGAAAWNFVVAGLLAVLLLPVAIQFGQVRLNAFDAVFLSGATVGFLNHLPTRLAAVILPIGVACALECVSLLGRRESTG